jgi:DNA-binding winged helix-turn-helix (wHTH) protein
MHEMLRVERDARELLRMTHELYSCLKEEEVLQRVANLACQVTGLSRCVFALVDEDRKNIVGAATNVLLPAAGITRMQELVVPIRQKGATETAMRTGNPVVVEDSRHDPRVPPELMERLGLVSLLIIPINVDDQWVGVMYLDNAGQKHHFGADEIEVAKTLGEQAATAIANARLYSEAQERIQNLMSETRAMIETKETRPRPTRPQALKCDNLEINLPQRRVFAAGNPVNLSWTEFELLRFLAANPASAFTRETIFRKVWKQEYYISTNLVDVCVHRLRQKIEANPAEPRYVVTVHGVGYMFAETPQRQ